MKIVLASHNAGKIRELTTMLAPFAIEVVSQSSLGIEDIEETGLSFVENSLLKARHAAKQSGLPALADDSGLAIVALNGAPGIYSARYAGVKGNDQANITKVLSEMAHVNDAHRHAEFHCVLSFMIHEFDPVPLICEGRWSGKILREPKGEHGFGYDPIFFVAEENKTAAELPHDLKNRISHRGQALQKLMQLLPDKLHECAKR